MPDISLASTVVVGPRQVSTELGSEVVVLGADAGLYFGLNEVGARVWALLQAPVRVSTVCETIRAEYDVTESECQHDVLELLRELSAKGLIDVQAELGTR